MPVCVRFGQRPGAASGTCAVHGGGDGGRGTRPFLEDSSRNERVRELARKARHRQAARALHRASSVAEVVGASQRCTEASSSNLAVLALHRIAALARDSGASPSGGGGGVARLVRRVRSSELAPKFWGQFVWALARLSEQDVVRECVSPEALALRLPALTPSGVASALWSAAAVRSSDPGAVSLLAQAALEASTAFRSVELAASAWALARLPEDPEAKRALRGLAAEALRRRWESFEAQSVSNVFWAVAVGEAEFASAWLPEAAATLRAPLTGFKPQELSNLLWALASATAGSMPLTQEILRESALRRAADFRPQEVANIAWAAATLRGPLCAKLLESVVDRPAAPRDLANVAWALAAVFTGDAHGSAAPRAERLLRRIGSVAVGSAVAEWSPQALVNTLWAFATVAVRERGAFADRACVALRACAVEVWTQKHLPNVAWAVATLQLRDGKLLEVNSAAALVHAHDLSLQGLANLAWSRAALSVKDEALFSVVGRTVAQRLPADLDSFRERAMQRPEETPQLAVSLAELAWSFSVVSLDYGILDSTRAALEALGRALDDALPACRPGGVSALVSSVADESGDMQPSVVRRGLGWCVLLKTPGWEVDSHETDRAEMALRGRRPLSALLRRHFASPLAERADLDFGFLHRLDTPSSGLILCALRHEELFRLRWLQATGAISRRYLVLCHGHVASARLDGRLRSDGRGRTVVAEDGQPAVTHVRGLARLASERGDLTLAECSIETGRRHQIRAHLSSAGHPVVCDGRYAPLLMDADLELCPRNFLHRFHLSWPKAADEGVGLNVVEAPLPPDLRASLRALRPSDAESQAAVAEAIAGEAFGGRAKGSLLA